jgi:hypothetical protein
VQRVLETPYFSHATSLAVVALVALGLAGVLLAAILRALVHRRAAIDAAAAAAGAGVLAPGPRILRGIVQTEDGAPAMTVSVEQTGKEGRSRRRGTRHTWTEVDRRVTAQAFDLVLEGGQRVRVEPDADAFLVDDLELVSRTGPITRLMAAKLEPGEQAYVEGELRRQRGARPGGEEYRGGSGDAWTMRPPAAGRMLLCTESLESRHSRRQRWWTWFAVAAGLVLGASQVAGYELFLRLHLHGATCTAELTELRHYTTRGRRGRTNHHYVAFGRVEACEGVTEPAFLVSDEIGYSLFESLGEGDRVPFVVDRRDPAFHQIGARAGLPRGLTWIGALVLAFLALIAWALHRSSLAWYEQKKVVHEGQGPL